MEKHTSGPWERKLACYGEHREQGNLTDVSDGYCIWWAVADETHEPIGWIKERADARLIAAAPDLLGALKGMMDCANIIHTGEDNQTQRAFGEAAQAVAKAEGR